MNAQDNGYLAAQRAYDRMVPDDEPDTTCEECEGEGIILSSPDANGEMHEYECPVCNGHGNMDAVYAEREEAAQEAKAEAREERMREERDVEKEWSGV